PNLLNPSGRQSTQPCGREHRAGLDNHLARPDVTAARPNVVPALDGAADLDLVAMFDNILDRDDGIGAVWNDPTGCDSHRLPGLECRSCGISGRNPRLDAKPSRRLVTPDGVAVHRGAWERRQIDLRPGWLGENATGRAFERHVLGRKRLRTLEDKLLGFGDGKQIRHVSRIS